MTTVLVALTVLFGAAIPASAASYHGTVRWNIAGSQGVKSGPTSGTIDLGTRTGSSWNNVSYTIPSLSSLGVTLKDGWTVNYVSVAGNSSGNRSVGSSFLLSMSGGSMYYYLKESHTHSYSWQYYNSSQHAYKCSGCGSISQYANHSYTCYQYDSSQHRHTCNTCGHTYYEAHSFGAWSNISSTQQQRTCSHCGYTETKTVQTQNYTVTYIDRNMQYKTETYKKGAQAAVINCTNTRNGYEFIGWNTSSSADTADYEVGDTFTVNSNMTLYAVWRLKRDVTLTYVDIGGSAELYTWNLNPWKTETHKSGTSVTLEEPRHKAYEFKGWATTKGGTPVYEAGDTITLNQDTTLYAVWEDAKNKHYYFYLHYNSPEMQLWKMDSSYGNLTGDTYTFKINYNYYVGWEDEGKEPTHTMEGFKFLGWTTKGAYRFGEQYVEYRLGDEFTMTATANDWLATKTMPYDPSSCMVTRNIYAVWDCTHEHDENGVCTDPDCEHAKKGFTCCSSMKIKKTRVSINGDTELKTAKVGDEIVWNVEITNSLNIRKTIKLAEKLSGAKLYDSNGNEVTEVTIDPGKAATLTAKYTVKPEDAGIWLKNTVVGTLDGDGKTYEGSDSGTQVKPNIEIVKKRVSVNGNAETTTAAPGDEIEWKVTVTNNLNVTKTVKLTETIDGAKLYGADGKEITQVTLAAGQSIDLTAKYTVKRTDTGRLKNTVTGTIDDGKEYKGSDSGTQIENPNPEDNGKGIEIKKTRTSSGNVKPGDKITWEIKVTNNSNLTKLVKLTEMLDGAKIFNSNGKEVTTAIRVPAGRTITLTAEYVVKDSDAGKTIVNTVVGTIGDGKEYKGTDGGTEIKDPNAPPKPPTDDELQSAPYWFQVRYKCDDCGRGGGTKANHWYKEQCTRGEVFKGEDGKYHWQITAHKAYWESKFGELLKNYSGVEHTCITEGDITVDFTWDAENEIWTWDEVDPVFHFIGPRPKATYKWLDANGNVIYEKQAAECEKAPVFEGEFPQKPEDDDHTYEPNGWKEPVTDEDGNIIYEPDYIVKDKEKKTLTVTWYDEDGETVLDRNTFKEGESEPAYSGETPTKPEDENNTYVFNGWDKTVDEDGNVKYTAKYTAVPKDNGGGDKDDPNKDPENPDTPDNPNKPSDPTPVNPDNPTPPTPSNPVTPQNPAAPNTPADIFGGGNVAGMNGTRNPSGTNVGGANINTGNTENIADTNPPLSAGVQRPNVTINEPEEVLKDGKTPLASGAKSGHSCCILHFLIMLLAIAAELCYTKSMKNRQAKIFDIRNELEEYRHNQG